MSCRRLASPQMLRSCTEWIMRPKATQRAQQRDATPKRCIQLSNSQDAHGNGSHLEHLTLDVGHRSSCRRWRHPAKSWSAKAWVPWLKYTPPRRSEWSKYEHVYAYIAKLAYIGLHWLWDKQIMHVSHETVTQLPVSI